MTDAKTAPAKEPKTELNVKLYSIGRAIADGEKLAPQAKAIYGVVAEMGGDFTRGELIAALEGKLATKQAPGNVLNFYMKKLLDSGLLKATEVPKSSLKTAA
jgi:hypothetical protein